MSTEVFEQISVDIDLQLFDIANEKHNDPTDRIKRVKSVSHFYSQWMHRMQKKEAQDTYTSIYDTINTQFDQSYTFQHFLSDYHFAILEKHLLAEERVQQNEQPQYPSCDAQSCIMMQRNNRNREYFRNNHIRRNELYFIHKPNESTIHDTSDETIARDIASQQILDSAHHFIHHTIHLPNQTLQQMYAVDRDNNDFDTICEDKYTKKVVQHLENIRKSSNRYRHPDQQSINDKFMTTNDTSSITKQIPQPDSDDAKKADSSSSILCFLDRVLFEIKNSPLTETDKIQMYHMLCDEHYDSECIVLDLEDKTCSNLYQNVSNISQIAFERLCNKVLVERQVSSSLYSSGYRYFYWPFYKDNEAERTVLFGHTIGDYNPGYKLKDWYVAPKYATFKDEMLYNRIMNFSLIQYDCTLQKAKDKFEAWVLQAGALACQVSAWESYYGIRKGQEISLQHVLALLLYTNFSKQCFELSATYRKCNEYESDFDLKQRHREYHYWAKLLRETVECFGTAAEDSKIKVFYHGISSSLIFNSTSIRLCGPVSTTASFGVAVNIFGSDGIVLDIPRRNVTQYYFDCPYWSDYANEDEKLFLGGLVHFEFETIRDVKNKMNYWCYVQVLTMFHFMSEGWQFKKKIKKWHYKALKLLIQEEMEGKVLQGVESLVPPYVLKLWHHFLCNVRNVEINWKYMRMQESNSGERYGYKTFAPRFVLKKWTSLDFGVFLKILPNLESITLYNWNKKKQFVTSIALSEILTQHLLETIEIVQSSPSLTETFREFNIVLPVDADMELEYYLMEHQDVFENKGWKLTQKTFDSAFHPDYESCEETLCIQKM
eukprot:7121_1